MSTPNKKLSLEDNPYHIKEFTVLELQRVLSEDFCDIELFGQRKVIKQIGSLYKSAALKLPFSRLRFFLRFRPWENHTISKIKTFSDSSYLYFVGVSFNRKK